MVKTKKNVLSLQNSFGLFPIQKYLCLCFCAVLYVSACCVHKEAICVHLCSPKIFELCYAPKRFACLHVLLEQFSHKKNQEFYLHCIHDEHHVLFLFFIFVFHKIWAFFLSFAFFFPAALQVAISKPRNARLLHKLGTLLEHCYTSFWNLGSPPKKKK